ncbi:MAG TPA: family 1 encapsulin nanocompartment shell protein [Anaerovoracaceae bacterium]|nr:family 1 encapsulin nanocompartment shell protein [Anaerovoracaceae bacterium]
MDFLSRESAPFSGELWNKIDETVIAAARRVLTGRRFLSLYGPLGAETLSVHVDDLSRSGSVEEDGALVKTGARSYQELPLIYSDFTLYWRDLENSQKNNLPFDLSAASKAAAQCAVKEDELIFFGSKKLGYEGLFTVKGSSHIKRSDWDTGENPFTDIAKGIELLSEQNLYGRLALILSPNLYTKLQRIQPGTGRMELERVSSLVDGNIFRTPVLGTDKAVLVCAEPQNMDLAVGQDFSTAYLELKDLNHTLRIIETVLPRIKRKDAIVIFD